MDSNDILSRDEHCDVCGGSGDLYASDGEGPWACYACPAGTQKHASPADAQQRYVAMNAMLRGLLGVEAGDESFDKLLAMGPEACHLLGQSTRESNAEIFSRAFDQNLLLSITEQIAQARLLLLEQVKAILAENKITYVELNAYLSGTMTAKDVIDTLDHDQVNGVQGAA